MQARTLEGRSPHFYASNSFARFSHSAMNRNASSAGGCGVNVSRPADRFVAFVDEGVDTARPPSIPRHPVWLHDALRQECLATSPLKMK